MTMTIRRALDTGATEPVSLSEAKAHCRVDTGDDDALILGLITAARQLCEFATHVSLMPTVCTMTLDAFPDNGLIELWHGPVNSVTWVKYLDSAGVQQTLAGASYRTDLQSNPGRIALAPNASWPSTEAGAIAAVSVSYKTGYGGAGPALPQAVKQWILLHVAHYYANREPAVALTVGTPAISPLPVLDGLLDDVRVWPLG